MAVTALVVNYNAGPLLHDCVKQLLGGTIKPRVLVIDNASTDGSAETLRGLYGSFPGLEVLFNPDNKGYAPAINQGLRLLDSEYVFIVNPDCLVNKATLELLQQALLDDAHAGIAAPCVRNPKGRVEKASLRRFPDPWNALMTMSGAWRLGRWLPFFRGVPVNPGALPETTVKAEAVSGACMLLRRQPAMDVGLMDEGYPLHCEDLDLMYRLRQAGWHCLYVPAARAVHQQGVSSRSRPWWVHRQKHRGMARFYQKFQAAHYGKLISALVHLGIWLRYLLLLPWVLVRK